MTNQVGAFQDIHWLMDILEHIDVGLVVMDQDFEIQLWNSFMQNHSAKLAREVMGKKLFQVFPELPESWFSRKVQSVLTLQNAAFTTWEQRPYLFKFKHYRPITGTAPHMYQNSTIIPLLDATGNVEQICLIIYDVTDTAINKIGQQQANQQLKELSRTDPLTQLNNRGYWEKCLIDEFKRFDRYGGDSCLIILDIDHFKKINDTYGHTVGDDAIRAVSREIRKHIRDVDTAGRYGGEEFTLILPETDMAGAKVVAERLRKAIEELVVHSDGHAIGFTISLGVSKITAGIANHTAWLEQADQALYKSKENGRNQVNIYEAKP